MLEYLRLMQQSITSANRLFFPKRGHFDVTSLSKRVSLIVGGRKRVNFFELFEEASELNFRRMCGAIPALRFVVEEGIV